MNRYLLSLLSFALLGSMLMADDAYTVMMKETQFDGSAPEVAKTGAEAWDRQMLVKGKQFTIISVGFHNEISGGIDLVRILRGSDVGEFATIQSGCIHMVSRPYAGPAGPAGPADVAVALKKLATDTLPNVTGVFTYQADEGGVQRFSCSAPNEGLVGMSYGGRVGVAQLKPEGASPMTVEIEDNKVWFSPMGKDKTGRSNQ